MTDITPENVSRMLTWLRGRKKCIGFKSGPSEDGGHMVCAAQYEPDPEANEAADMLEALAAARDAAEAERDDAEAWSKRHHADLLAAEARYQREVNGLNSEGDPIGGDPPIGLKARVAALTTDNARLQATIDQMAGGWGEDAVAVEELRAEIASLRAGMTVKDAAGVDIAAIENGGKRWHGEDHRVVSVRWEPYKPDGQRQMKAKGRWQEMQVKGDFHQWINCDKPIALATPETRT